MAAEGNNGKTREQRLAEQLRANLARRKEQGRSRRAGGADLRREGVALGHADGEEDHNPPDGGET